VFLQIRERRTSQLVRNSRIIEYREFGRSVGKSRGGENQREGEGGRGEGEIGFETRGRGVESEGSEMRDEGLRSGGEGEGWRGRRSVRVIRHR